MSDRFDVIVIGSGSGGRAVAGRLADAGRRVAMVESGLVGGECPYWACMPAKTLLRPGEAIAQARRVPGVAASIRDWDEIVAFRDDVTAGRNDAAKAARYTARGVEILRGHGTLDGPGRVIVAGAVHHCDRVVIATGSAPVIPEIPGLEAIDFWTNREAMELRRVPASAAVLGAGPVGIEIGQMLSRYGCRVTLIGSEDRLLDREEPAVGDVLGSALAAEGIELVLGATVTAAKMTGGSTRVTVDACGDRDVERLVIATGRRPRVDHLGLDTVGITPGDAGIAVDDRCRAAEGVWAVGDVSGKGAFTHVAAYQGRLVCADILGQDVRADYRAVPRSIFSDPEVAAVGMTAAQAREAGIETASAAVPLTETERSSTYGRGVVGCAGVLADTRERTLIGAYAVGPLATEWIHLAVLAVRARVPVEVLADTIAQFPTFTEAFVTAVRRLEL